MKYLLPSVKYLLQGGAYYLHYHYMLISLFIHLFMNCSRYLFVSFAAFNAL